MWSFDNSSRNWIKLSMSLLTILTFRFAFCFGPSCQMCQLAFRGPMDRMIETRKLG